MAKRMCPESTLQLTMLLNSSLGTVFVIMGTNMQISCIFLNTGVNIFLHANSDGEGTVCNSKNWQSGSKWNQDIKIECQAVV